LIRLYYSVDALEISINESFACYYRMAKPINWTSTPRNWNTNSESFCDTLHWFTIKTRRRRIFSRRISEIKFPNYWHLLSVRRILLLLIRMIREVLFSSLPREESRLGQYKGCCEHANNASK